MENWTTTELANCFVHEHINNRSIHEYRYEDGTSHFYVYNERGLLSGSYHTLRGYDLEQVKKLVEENLYCWA